MVIVNVREVLLKATKEKYIDGKIADSEE